MPHKLSILSTTISNSRFSLLRLSGNCNQKGCNPTGVRCSITQNQFTTIRIQQILTAAAFPAVPAPGQSRLTAAFVYKNKPIFKDLLKSADYQQWVNYAGRVSDPKTVTNPTGGWLTYDSLKANIMVGWGSQAGSLSKQKLEDHVEMEIESVRELEFGESEKLMGGGGGAKGGGGCTKELAEGATTEEQEATRLLGGGGALCPPPPSPFMPEILVTYYYTFMPLNLGFSGRGTARDSFNNAINNWRPFSAASDPKFGYEAIFLKKLRAPTVSNTPVGQVVGLTTKALSVSDAAFANGYPTQEPSGLPAGASSGLANASAMPFYAYIFVVLFLLLALGIVYFFCHKKAKIMEAKLDETFFTGKKNDEELLKAQAQQQEATLAKFEQQMVGVGPPPPGMSPHMSMARKSFSGDSMGYPPPPHMSQHPSPGGRRLSQGPPPPGHH